MIDSINFILNGVSYLDIPKLVALGITYYPLRYKKGTNGKTYVVYGDVKEEAEEFVVNENIAGSKKKKFAVSGFGFNYNNMYFRYLPQFDCIIITANVHKVLGKTDILLSDRDNYISNIEYVVKLLFNVEFSQLELHRIDYYVDLELDYKVMYEYLHLLYKHKSAYQHINRINNYETSIYITSLYGQKSINIYDKYKCEKDKYIKAYQKAYNKTGISLEEYQETHPTDYEKYKNIFRIEVQNTKKLINQQTKELQKDKTKDLIIEHKVNKSIYGYWNQKSMETYYFDFLEPFLYKGTYYKLKKAKQMIKKEETIVINGKEESISENDKSQLKEFIEIVNQYGITNAIESKDTKADTTTPKWCGATISQYMDDLETLGINVLKLDSKRRKHLKREKERIEKSNHSKVWKKQLIEFMVAVGKYGITEVTAKKNKEVTPYGKIKEHKTWCKATVEKYIEMLGALGINPVTLDNNSELDSLESLYTLAQETAKEKYFDLEIPTPPAVTSTTSAPVVAPPTTYTSKEISILEPRPCLGRRNKTKAF